MTYRTIALALIFLPSLAWAQQSDEYSFEARIDEIHTIACDNHPEDSCEQITATIETGPQNGQQISIIHDPADDLGGRTMQLSPQMSVIVQAQNIGEETQYFISDEVRRTPMIWLAILFAVSVFLFGGLKAMRSFLGMVVSFLILLFFIIPRILAGDSPVIVSLVGACAIMIITFLLCHGWNKKTWAAFGGTAGSLAVTAVLAAGFSVYAHMTGTADEEMLFLLADYPALNTRGILLAGIIIGSLGVLDDITISQASAVFELRRANPLLSMAALYRSALRIGADHIAAAVNTLVLAYAGTALPLLLLLVGTPTNEAWFTFINREMIAQEIIRTLTGSIGLLAAVPLTTLLASWMAVRVSPQELEKNPHTHHHGHAH